MEPSRSAEHGIDRPAHVDLGEQEAELLLDLAERAIRARLTGGPPPEIDVAELPAGARRPQGAFVTLHVAGRLNGCIGNIGGGAPLAVSVAELAVKAAFHDPRLPALRITELHELRIEVSVLSPTTAIPAATRAELFAHLRPGVHGLVLRSGRRQALFLPAVWEQLPHPDDFVDHLLHKAGLPVGSWPSDMFAESFTTASVHRELG